MRELINDAGGEPKRDEAKVEASRTSLHSAVGDVKQGNFERAKQNVLKAWEDFNAAYAEGAESKDARKFLDAVNQIIGGAPAENQGEIMEAVTVEAAKSALHSMNDGMGRRDGSAAFTKISQSWTLFQQAFAQGIPQDRLDNYFNAIVSVIKDKAPHMVPILEDVMLLRKGYALDSNKSQALQRDKALDMLVMLCGRVARYAFEEKAKPGERVETRAMGGSAGLMMVQAWERENLKHIQSQEWRDRYDSVLKRLEDIAMGR